MKKITIYLLLLFSMLQMTSLKAATAEEELKETRKLFKNASYSLEHLTKFSESALKLDYDCYAKAYQAAGTMMEAKFEKNPFKKINRFSEGRKSLEQVIKANPENPEFRFIRLAIQLNTPKMLNYKDNVKEDTTLIKVFINSNKHEDEDLVKMLKAFLELYSL